MALFCTSLPYFSYDQRCLLENNVGWQKSIRYGTICQLQSRCANTKWTSHLMFVSPFMIQRYSQHLHMCYVFLCTNRSLSLTFIKVRLQNNLHTLQSSHNEGHNIVNFSGQIRMISRTQWTKPGSCNCYGVLVIYYINCHKTKLEHSQ